MFLTRFACRILWNLKKKKEERFLSRCWVMTNWKIGDVAISKGDLKKIDIRIVVISFFFFLFFLLGFLVHMRYVSIIVSSIYRNTRIFFARKTIQQSVKRLVCWVHADTIIGLWGWLALWFRLMILIKVSLFFVLSSSHFLFLPFLFFFWFK